MSDRTWETQNPRGDAALIDPGPTHNRTNEDYNKKCREVLAKSDPGSLKDKK